MRLSLAFDVYGTLIDTHSVVSKLEAMVCDKVLAQAFTQRWREKQLEYAFRRGLMRDYVCFATCTAQALDYCCAYYQTELSQKQKQELLTFYRVLPAFGEVADSLALLQQQGHRLFAFSNGSNSAVEVLLAAAGIRQYFNDIVSVDEIQSFKPSPAVYEHFLTRSNSTIDKTWLISSNPFDVLGALASGWHSAWIQRSEQQVFDPWGPQPSLLCNNLSELVAKLTKPQSQIASK